MNSPDREEATVTSEQHASQHQSMRIVITVKRDPADDMYRAAADGKDLGVVLAAGTDEQAGAMAASIVTGRVLGRKDGLLGADHIYLSTGCFHGDHGYCAAPTGKAGPKKPAQCKKCTAPCVCACHYGKSWPRRAWDLGLLHKGGDPHHCPACLRQPEPPRDFVCPGDNDDVLANPQTHDQCLCPHPADEHSMYGCTEGCGCAWMPVRLPSTLEKLRADLDDARTWARHGYEIGQMHCSWSDHGVAPAWLTEGWPRHFGACDQLTGALADRSADLAQMVLTDAGLRDAEGESDLAAYGRELARLIAPQIFEDQTEEGSS